MVTMRRRRAASAVVAVAALLGALLGARRPSARPTPICDPPSVSRPEPALDALLLRYAQALFTQVGQSVVCNQRHTLRQRCARWLLTTHDRVAGEEFHLTHEFLAAMLGVRRAGVTVAAGELQRAGLISYRRGNVRILDRAGLEEVSCECYSKIHDAYDRIVGVEPVGVEAR